MGLTPKTHTLDHQWLFLHRLDLLFEHVDLRCPVVAGAKPWEVDGKGRVLPAAGQPGAIVDEAQGAQGFDERQLAAVEGAELLVAVDQGAQLRGALAAVAAQQHPQILHGGAAAGVVQVHKMRTAVGGVGRCPQDVAGVTVAMQADGGYV